MNRVYKLAAENGLFQRLPPFSDSYEIYSEQQLSHFEERIQKEKE